MDKRFFIVFVAVVLAGGLLNQLIPYSPIPAGSPDSAYTWDNLAIIVPIISYAIIAFGASIGLYGAFKYNRDNK